MSSIVPANDTNALDLFNFFRNLIQAMVLPYTSRDHIAFEFPDGSRHPFVRDDTLPDGSLITSSLLKLRCEDNQMVVLTPD